MYEDFAVAGLVEGLRTQTPIASLLSISAGAHARRASVPRGSGSCSSSWWMRTLCLTSPFLYSPFPQPPKTRCEGPDERAEGPAAAALPLASIIFSFIRIASRLAPLPKCAGATNSRNPQQIRATRSRAGCAYTFENHALDGEGGVWPGLAGSLGRPGRGVPKCGDPGGVAGRYKKDGVAL